MKWFEMETRFGDFRICIDKDGFVWFCAMDVIKYLGISNFVVVSRYLKNYMAQDWVYEKNPYKMQVFDGCDVPCFYDDFVWYICIYLGMYSFAEFIEKEMPMVIDKTWIE